MATRDIRSGGPRVVFDGSPHLHLVSRKRHALLCQVDAVLGTIQAPDSREPDPIPGRERFYRAGFSDLGAWLVVVVDFNEKPGWVVTVFVSYQDPRVRQR